MLRCFIADDESPARDRLRRLLSADPDISIVGEAADGVSTLEQVTACTPDVLLLDIQMPELDGLGVASALLGAARAPIIIFVTAYDEHAVRAFELAALDYLVKPVSAPRLEAAIERARKLGRTDPGGHGVPVSHSALAQLGPRPRSRMAVRSGAKFIVFDPSRVQALLSRDHYTSILLESGELLADDALEQLGRRFDPEQFLRIHRSAIINLGALKELVHVGDRKYVAVLLDRDATRVPVSRERLGALKAALGID